MKSADYQKDIKIIIQSLRQIPTSWDGKRSILELKESNYQWRQMEWTGFYFEFLCKKSLEDMGFIVPGKRYGQVEFDSFRSINWDMKSSAIKSHSHRIILNDKKAIDESIEEYGAHGLILALLDVEYNDDNRSFQKWHARLKGGISKYEKDRIRRKATSRYRKTNAQLQQILFFTINHDNQAYLDIHKQGRNSDGSPRNIKYMLDIENSDHFEVGRIEF